MTEETAEQKLARYEAVLDVYMAELDKLRDENERLKSGADAHTTLQAIYIEIQHRPKVTALRLQRLLCLLRSQSSCQWYRLMS